MTSIKDLELPLYAATQSYEQAAHHSCIYLDNAATTPLSPKVRDVMFALMSKEVTGNSSSKQHPIGAFAAMTVQKAREQVADAIGAKPNEVVFTSGATESNNLAIKGIAKHLKSIGKTRILTSVVEHKSVLNPLSQLAEEGFEVTALPVKPCGMITPDVIEDALDTRTGMVCVQAVNNELGTIQPISKIAEVLKDKDVLFHCDAAQALGKLPFSVEVEKVDFASFSAHKVHGPQGIGALYVRADKFSLLEPLNAGGGQENGLRSGTLPVVLCAGFGEACTLLEDDRDYLHKLRMQLLVGIAKLEPTIYGHRERYGNVAGIVSARFPGVDSESLIMSLPSLAISTGSACATTGNGVSHVIRAITDDEQAPKETIRISFGRQTTLREIHTAAEEIFAAVTAIRELQEV